MHGVFYELYSMQAGQETNKHHMANQFFVTLS